MSLIITRNFKREKAKDAADKTEKAALDSAIVALFQPLADAQAELRDGNKKSNAKNVLAAAIAAAEKEFKGNPFSSRDKRIIDDAKKVLAQFDSAEFHVGQRVRAKDPRWTGYQGHALGNGIYTVKKVDRDGTVKLDGFLDVWISPSALVEANDACGNRSK